VFYGWRIVAVTFLTHFISVGFIFYSYGVFFKALAAEFGGSRLGVALGLTIMNVIASAIAPFLGRALDRGSVRVIMCAGALLMAAGFFALMRIDALWQFYLLLGSLLAVGSSMMGGLPGSTLVARWFARRRGMALGIATMGISLSGLAMAPLATRLIAEIGWRYSFFVYGVLTIALVVPAVWLVVVNRPEDLGLDPDGQPPRGRRAPAPAPVLPLDPAGQVVDPPALAAWSARSAFRDRRFWIISLVVALNFGSNGAVLTHIVPHATDMGFRPLDAAFVLSAIAGMGVVGKVFFGLLVDRVDKRLAFWLAIGLQALGVSLIEGVRDYGPLLAAGAVFGLGMGGVVPLWGSLIGAAFGRHAFGRVMGLMSPVMIPVQSFGIPFAGWVFDETGSYALAFRTFIGLYAAAALGLALLRLPREEPGLFAR
jgi:MFS family permease